MTEALGWNPSTQKLSTEGLEYKVENNYKSRKKMAGKINCLDKILSSLLHCTDIIQGANMFS
jgi:hypothetical protein